MYFELYVDVLFLVNFLMNYILLLFIWRVLHCDTRHFFIVLGAVIGAFLTCILIVLPIPSAILEFVLFHTIVNTCMIQVGFKIKSISVFLKALILLYIGAFFMGGIMESLAQYVKVGSMLLLFAIVGYYMALGMWHFLAKLQRWNSHIVEVELCEGETRIKVRGLIDTGNNLCDPITGMPVSIVTQKIAKEFAEITEKKVRFIPYQSIGKACGAMAVFQIEKMYVTGETQYCFEKPLLGISEERISAGNKYGMILNPNLF